jgi:hypothetical protein
MSSPWSISELALAAVALVGFGVALYLLIGLFATSTAPSSSWMTSRCSRDQCASTASI